METIDDDIAARSADFIDRTNQTGKPFFMWINFTHMHLRTHPKPASVGQSGRWQDTYHDVMIDHDRNVGTVLAKLDEFGLTENTIVIYGTDNGPHANTWPDGATTPFRSEKNTNWEGAFRVPYLIRWPGKIRAGIVSNEVVSHHEWMPTLVAAAGMPDLKERLLAGYTVGDRTFKVLARWHYGVSHLSTRGYLGCTISAPIRLSRPPSRPTPIGTGIWTTPL